MKKKQRRIRIMKIDNGILTEVICNKYLTICRNYESDMLFTVFTD